ncbi:hemerythrin domain-containing protein [Pseudoalteromonas aliena]|uniref:Hemerythrin-like domain-containing protein n=1 Tax=Pseudoalteromonas aliena SW19 TaxID=1314866 RepID=A0ABR9DXP6_9GAMM|nr:hemerythrin domain-containing protein [Pseudoalteromonas aliena]MBE0359136.1 hypothetical protein [Pseudoalteromonas aliena SW19]
MSIDFTQADFDVTKRRELPLLIKKSLINIERGKWHFHPKYHGKAQFFIHYHEGLMYTSSQILKALKSLLESQIAQFTIRSELKKIEALCYQLFENAERHHLIEDHSYFPGFKKIEPKLAAGIDLLENDHKRLSTALFELKISLNQSLLMGFSYSTIGKLYQRAETVDLILTQHLYDEEEIIIPIFLKY